MKIQTWAEVQEITQYGVARYLAKRYGPHWEELLGVLGSREECQFYGYYGA